MSEKEFDEDVDILLDEEEDVKVEEPKLYKVIFHNDDYTTMEFVILVLQAIFHKTDNESISLTMDIHHSGSAVVGTYTHEVATTNVHLTQKLAEENDFPLLVTIEKC